MTYYILIAFCIIILLAYFFDITAKYSKIPGVLLLILTGIGINHLADYFSMYIPEINKILPVMGTLGLVLIVLEGSMDLTLRKNKTRLITGSLFSSISLLLIFVVAFTCIAVYFFQYDIKTSLINIIPIAIISSAVAIPSAVDLSTDDKAFVTYESSLSDIIGILFFNLIYFSDGNVFSGVFIFFTELIVMLIFSVLFSAGLAILLHKINHNVKYVIIMTAIILVYALAKLFHLPSLLVVLIFGVVMNNNALFKNILPAQIINFEEFNTDLNSFKNIVTELTFVIRSFFFILFGFYTSISDLMSLKNLLIALIIAASIFISRALFFKIALRVPLNPLLFFAPRGLVTILLFLSIPATMLLPLMNVGVVTQVIFITILVMTFGSMFFKKKVDFVETDVPNE
ncbi:MAG: cation:proton antiporter [Bacteroidales bacterium]